MARRHHQAADGPVNERGETRDEQAEVEAARLERQPRVYVVGIARSCSEYADVRVIARSQDDAERAVQHRLEHDDTFELENNVSWEPGGETHDERVTDTEEDATETAEALRASGAYHIDATTEPT